jgi:hypothetical protein
MGRGDMRGSGLCRLLAGHGGRPGRLGRATADAERALLELAASLEAEVELQAAQGGDATPAWELLCRVRAFLDDLGAAQPVPRPAAAGEECRVAGHLRSGKASVTPAG